METFVAKFGEMEKKGHENWGPFLSLFEISIKVSFITKVEIMIHYSLEDR